VSWDFSAAEQRSSDEMRADLARLADNPQYQARAVTSADARAAIESAATVIDAEFEFPFPAHVPMEPMNCVTEPTANGVRFHDGCQMPGGVVGAATQVLKLKPEQVEVNTVYAGGSFGRRATPMADYQVEAMACLRLAGWQDTGQVGLESGGRYPRWILPLRQHA
jgi:isoquinoline 1-oxidoreductase beta subunit